jgi:hypothetical protein
MEYIGSMANSLSHIQFSNFSINIIIWIRIREPEKLPEYIICPIVTIYLKIQLDTEQ